jgi:hypothetical protein
MKPIINDKIILGAIYLSIVVVIMGLLGILLEKDNLRSVIDIGKSIFVLSSGFLILRYSSFAKSNEYKYIKLAIGIVIIGAMLKIMHWSFLAQVLLLGYLAVFLSYLIFKLRHVKSEWISWIKILFLLTFLGGRYFSLIHWPYYQELTIVSVLLLGIIVFNIIRENKLSFFGKSE